MCAKAVRQFNNGIKSVKGPTYFPNKAPLRLNPALVVGDRIGIIPDIFGVRKLVLSYGVVCI